jgi:hypothetical protein
VRLTPSSATKPPKRLLRSSTSRSGAMAVTDARV